MDIIVNTQTSFAGRTMKPPQNDLRIELVNWEGMDEGKWNTH